MIQLCDAIQLNKSGKGKGKKGDFAFTYENVESYRAFKNYESNPCYVCDRGEDKDCMACGEYYYTEEESFFEIVTKTNVYRFGFHRSADEDLDDYFLDMMKDAEQRSVRWTDYIRSRENHKQKIRKEEEEKEKQKREGQYEEQAKRWLNVSPKIENRACNTWGGYNDGGCIFLKKRGAFCDTAYCEMGWAIQAEKGKRPRPLEPCIRISKYKSEAYSYFVTRYGAEFFSKRRWETISDGKDIRTV